MRTRPQLLLVALLALAALAFVVRGQGEVQLVTVTLIVALGSLLHRTRPTRLRPDVR